MSKKVEITKEQRITALNDAITNNVKCNNDSLKILIRDPIELGIANKCMNTKNIAWFDSRKLPSKNDKMYKVTPYPFLYTVDMVSDQLMLLYIDYDDYANSDENDQVFDIKSAKLLSRDEVIKSVSVGDTNEQC